MGNDDTKLLSRSPKEYWKQNEPLHKPPPKGASRKGRIAEVDRNGNIPFYVLSRYLFIDMNNIQEKLSDIVYALSEEKIVYEQAYSQIIELLKTQKVFYESQGLIPTIELLIEDLEEQPELWKASQTLNFVNSKRKAKKGEYVKNANGK